MVCGISGGLPVDECPQQLACEAEAFALLACSRHVVQPCCIFSDRQQVINQSRQLVEGCWED
eukprot:7811116-Prorocentrum_lima.AAC.1